MWANCGSSCWWLRACAACVLCGPEWSVSYGIMILVVQPPWCAVRFFILWKGSSLMSLLYCDWSCHQNNGEAPGTKMSLEMQMQGDNASLFSSSFTPDFPLEGLKGKFLPSSVSHKTFPAGLGCLSPLHTSGQLIQCSPVVCVSSRLCCSWKPGYRSLPHSQDSYTAIWFNGHWQGEDDAVELQRGQGNVHQESWSMLLWLCLWCTVYPSKQRGLLSFSASLLPGAGFHADHTPSYLLSFNTVVPTLASTFLLPESARANQTCTYLIRIMSCKFPCPQFKETLNYFKKQQLLNTSARSSGFGYSQTSRQTQE